MSQNVLGGDDMRTTLALDDDLVREAQRLTGTTGALDILPTIPI